MKLCSFSTEGGSVRAGLVVGSRVFDIGSGLALLGELELSTQASSLLSLLRVGESAFNAVRVLAERIDQGVIAEQLASGSYLVSEVLLEAPLPRPNSIRDFLVFEEHLINSTYAYAKRLIPPVAWLHNVTRKLTGKALLKPPKVWYELPIYYKGNADSVVGPDHPIQWPHYSQELDYELEFGVYLFKTGKDISKDEAKSFIAGYTVFNDFSARDIQLREMGGRLGPTKGKDFDTGNVMGPYLVTPDEVGDPYSLSMKAYVNGALWSSGNSRDMRYSFEEMIAYLSQSETLHPGDFLGSGTVGSGCGLELGRRLCRGDRVTLEVERLGRLENPIAS